MFENKQRMVVIGIGALLALFAHPLAGLLLVGGRELGEWYNK